MKYSYYRDSSLVVGAGNCTAGGRYISFLSNVFVHDSVSAASGADSDGAISAVTISAVSCYAVSVAVSGSAFVMSLPPFGFAVTVLYPT